MLGADGDALGVGVEGFGVGEVDDDLAEFVEGGAVEFNEAGAFAEGVGGDGGEEAGEFSEIIDESTVLLVEAGDLPKGWMSMKELRHGRPYRTLGKLMVWHEYRNHKLRIVHFPFVCVQYNFA